MKNQPEPNNKTPTPEQIRKRKMLLAVPLMVIAFLLCIYWIFFSGKSAEDQQKQSGINMSIPEPKAVTMADDKRKAYEQEQVQTMRKEKIQSLQDYFTDLKTKPTATSSNDSTFMGSQPMKTPNKNAITQSAQAYKNAAAQVNGFYQTPKTEHADDEKGLEKQIAELKSKFETQKNAKVDQVELMEKSYQMAAKYLGQKEEVKLVEKEKFSVAVSKPKQKTVTSLAKSPSHEDLKNSFSQPRNLGFNTAVGEFSEPNTQNTLKACVAEDQKLTNGARVKLRLLEDMKAGNFYIPQNSIIYGTANIQGERLQILIPNIEYNGNIIPVELLVYDTDGNQGIYVPGSLSVSAGKETLGNLGQSLGSTVSIAQGVEQQLVMDATKIGITGASQFLGKKFKEVNVNLKAGYQLLLAPKKLNQ